MTGTPEFDHIAITVPDVEAQVDRLTASFGMVAKMRSEGFGLVIDPATGFRFELSKSTDGQVGLRHLGFRVDDVDSAHDALVAQGMDAARAPHRQDFAAMYTSYLSQQGVAEVQLVTYDD